MGSTPPLQRFYLSGEDIEYSEDKRLNLPFFGQTRRVEAPNALV